MLRKFLLLFSCFLSFTFPCWSQAPEKLSINRFTNWLTGRDSATVQLIPSIGSNALISEDEGTVAHVKFKVAQYGEVSFPIKPSAAIEARPVNLSKSKFIKIQYKANQEVVLQLRQTGSHGGIHNHYILPRSESFATYTVYFSSFKGGLTSLDLSNVAKFNFAFLANNPAVGYAELIVRSFKIDHYKP
jgi:hypothetical protein